MDDEGGVGGVDIGCVDDSGRGGDGDDDGDGGCGSAKVRRAWFTRRDEHEYGWSSSIDDDGGCLPPVCKHEEEEDKWELFT